MYVSDWEESKISFTSTRITDNVLVVTPPLYTSMISHRIYADLRIDPEQGWGQLPSPPPLPPP